ncbi:MAG: Nudix family hydrolase [Pseudomonadota bacterium]
MSAKLVHVAVAVIYDGAGRVLCTQRLPHQHLAGLWEFPGGKLEAGESLADGLRREIHEELGIETGAIAPLLRVEHRYPEKTVLLDVWRVLDWRGVPHGREGQPLRWQHPDEMQAGEFPPADVPIIAALRLPSRYVISPDADDEAELAGFVQRVRAADIRLLQVRLKKRPDLALSLQEMLRAAVPSARLLVNSDTLAALPSGSLTRFDGVHLTAAALQSAGARAPGVCAASCHNAGELALAFALGADFATLSPVLATASHPDVPSLGWDRFAALTSTAGLPVYALGGMHAGRLDRAVSHGAIGIAGITAMLAES